MTDPRSPMPESPGVSPLYPVHQTPIYDARDALDRAKEAGVEGAGDALEAISEAIEEREDLGPPASAAEVAESAQEGSDETGGRTFVIGEGFRE